MKSKKNLVIGVLILVVIIMSVGYASLAQQLTINGTSKISASWNVEITGITQMSSKGAQIEAGYPKYTATDANFNVKLDYPGSYAIFEITIKNNGTIDASLDSISGLIEANSASPVYLKYDVTGVNTGDRLNAGGTTTATVTVSWDVDETTVPEGDVSKTATIHLNYVQAD